MKFKINLGKMSMDESSVEFDMTVEEMKAMAFTEIGQSVIRHAGQSAVDSVASKIFGGKKDKDCKCTCTTIPNDKVPKDIMDAAEVKDADFSAINAEGKSDGDEYLALKLKAACDEVKSLKSYINDTISGQRDDSDDNILFAIKRIRRINTDIMAYKAAITAANNRVIAANNQAIDD